MPDAVENAALRLAPRKDRFARKTAVATHDDLHMREAGADGRHDFLKRLEGSITAVALSGAQLRPQTHISAEAEQRQVTVGVIVAVEKAPFLPAVQRVISCIEVEHQHLCIARKAAHAEVQERRLNRLWLRVQLAVMIRVLSSQLKAVQGRRTRQRCAAMSAAPPLRTQHILLPSRRGQQRIAPQVGVIVEVFITQRQRVNALSEQFPHAVVDERGIASIHKTSRQSAGDAQARINLSEQECTAIATELSAGKISHDIAGPEFIKKQLTGETLCRAGCGLRVSGMCLHARL